MRALQDPVIVHSSTQKWESSQDNQLYKDVRAARLKRNIEIPIDERIEYATWPETVLYFSTLSMDSKYMNDDVSDLYQYTFRRYLENWTDTDIDQQPSPISSDPNLSDFQQNRLDDLRFGIKKDQDKYFVEERYDDLNIESVPRTFWLTEYEVERSQDKIDDFTYSALNSLEQG
jgi:hypothetical protein